jgi:predicted amidophosphoribosyltransferase
MGLLALVLPSRCAVCGTVGPALCASCDDDLIRISPPVCDRCGCPGAWPVRRCVECAGRRLAFARARGALVYEVRARRLVSAWKERGRRDLAPLLAAIVTGVLGRPSVEALTFVPGDPERARARGHVPAERLAAALAERWEIPVERLLARTGPAPRQAALPRSDRRANVRGAFAPRGPAPHDVVLVDDVYTTGATASACATELRRAGARRVEVVCLARAVR